MAFKNKEGRSRGSNSPVIGSANVSPNAGGGGGGSSSASTSPLVPKAQHGGHSHNAPGNTGGPRPPPALAIVNYAEIKEFVESRYKAITESPDPNERAEFYKAQERAWTTRGPMFARQGVGIMGNSLSFLGELGKHRESRNRYPRDGHQNWNNSRSPSSEPRGNRNGARHHK